ncbi:MAG: hypothetical protein OXC62_06595 [Aestuariivita sp.]|nr:hypothetical protein [Aestuariivita sp.]
MDASLLKPIYSTKLAHIITRWGIMRTSAQAEPVGSIRLHAKDRTNGTVRCVAADECPSGF